MKEFIPKKRKIWYNRVIETENPTRNVDIPVRTLEAWEAGKRKMPDYVLRLLSYYIKREQGIKDGKVIVEDTDGKNK